MRCWDYWVRQAEGLVALSTAFGKETRLIHDIPHAMRINENKLCGIRAEGQERASDVSISVVPYGYELE